MTEQEIISYLKENRTKGVAFGFMPEEVKAWCGFNSPNKIFRVYNGIWSDLCYIDCFDARYAYCLSEDYEPKSEFKPHWQEFDIDEEGCFDFDDLHSFWHQWSAFLALNKDKFNAFGGWLYENDYWCMIPQVSRSNELLSYSRLEVKPQIPAKIRFWRYRE